MFSKINKVKKTKENYTYQNKIKLIRSKQISESERYKNQYNYNTRASKFKGKTNLFLLIKLTRNRSHFTEDVTHITQNQES